MKYTMPTPKRTPFETSQIDSIQFSVLSRQKIQSYSVLEISEQYLYDNDKPASKGLFDLRLGISGPSQKCMTCSESKQCPGHFGHIKLVEPVLHIGFIETICKVLRCVCCRCFRLKRPHNKEIRDRMKQIKKVSDPSKRLNLMSKLLQNKKKCNAYTEQQDLFDKNYKPCFGLSYTKISSKNYKIFYVDQQRRTCYFDRNLIANLLRTFSCYDLETEIIGFCKTKPIDLLIQVLAVVPPQVRPHLMINSQTKCEDDITMAYLKIIRINKQLAKISIKASQKNELIDTLQKTVASIMIKLRNNKKDSTKTKKQVKNIKSISQRLQKKQGRFRQNLLGKRVDHSARSVITPDPNLDLNEIGVPENIAKKLSYPEKVTIMNYDQIVQLCLQSKIKFLISSPQLNLRNEQTVINVSKITASTKQQMSSYVNVGMIAERCLKNGDYVLVNRQPTLHRMSMMAHKVRILPHNTLRINLSVCMPYNADFDGDQMNIHVPQSYEVASELKNISSVQNQIVGPKNGTTSMGFTQDSLLGACLITSRDTFLSREDFMNLVMNIKQDNHQEDDNILQAIPIPAILKPQALWTGKQLINLILPRIIRIHSFKSNLQDSNLLIRNGEILSGILQKEYLNNIIHTIWMEKGPLSSQIFINNFQKIIVTWLTTVGFSIGASDIAPEIQVIKNKQKQEQAVNKLYFNILNKFRSTKQIHKQHLHQLGRKINNSLQCNVNLQLNNQLSRIQQIVKSCHKFSGNNIYKIIQAKSKGSETNLAQILYSVGNQNINGQRCPLGFYKRSLPHFAKDDNSPFARGYVISSFYEGLKPHELFFHSMGGRQGLSDTAVKTSRVGYIQRKIIKSLQNCIVNYDSSVRDCRNNLVQYIYGEDGFCSQYIEKHRCFAAEYSKSVFRQTYKWKQDQLKKVYHYNAEEIKLIKRQYSDLFKSRKLFKKIFCTNVQSPSFQYYCPISVDRIINKIKQDQNKIESKKQPKIKPLQIYQSVRTLIQECTIPPEKLKQVKQMNEQIALNNSKKQKISKSEQYQSFSDQFQRQDIQNDKYYNRRSSVQGGSQFKIFVMHLRFCLSSRILVKVHELSQISFYKLINQIKQKYFKSLAPAGQAVGCLAGQSIGQPTTQMTLNTFHLAGISDRNVTLGLPRLEQLLNCTSSTASKIPKSFLVIYPKKPILYSESSKSQNQSYLLDMLTYHLPERRIADFVESTCFLFKPAELMQKQKYLNKLKQESTRTSYLIQLTFSYSKIPSSKLWVELVEKMQRKCYKSLEIDDVVEFNDVSERCQNPKIVLRYIHQNSLNENIAKQQKQIRQSKIMAKLQNLQTQVKNIKICGIDGVKSVKLSKKTLCLEQKQSQSNFCKQYAVFQANGDCTNLRNCLSHEEVNSVKTYSNNIVQIQKTLGIEAARQALINQFKQVLRPYGIEINYRHLSVLCDTMCLKGSVTPVNRDGLAKLKSVSTITKASYQMTTKNLLNAAAFSTKDVIGDISQKIIFGQLTPCGTSKCQIVLDVQKSHKYAYKPDLDIKKITSCPQSQNSLQKTPNYDQSVTYDNSMIEANKSPYTQLNNSYNRSPGYFRSPNICFSPTYIQSPAYIKTNPNQKHISPKYFANNLNYNMKSPLYQNQRTSAYGLTNIGAVSPSYNIQRSSSISPLKPTQNNTLANQLEPDKKEEDEDDQQTQRTLINQPQRYKTKEKDQQQF